MITRNRFSKIKKGNVILMRKGKSGFVLRPVLSFKNMCITFKKITGGGYRSDTTVYTYSDIYKKIIGIYSIKK